MKVNIIDMLFSARESGYAIGAFNIVDPLTANAIALAAESSASPVIIQTSVKTVQFFGAEQLGAYLHKVAESVRVPVAVHLDHCMDIELIKRCLDSGWSSVMFDGSHMSLAENIRLTSIVKELSLRYGASVEGELGKIGGEEDGIGYEGMESVGTNLADVIRFADETGADAIAPAIGTAHGHYRKEPKLDWNLLENISKNSKTPVVIHGGTGLDNETYRKLVKCGAAKINISTALKEIYLSATLSEGSKTVKEPINLLAEIKQNTKTVVEEFLAIFGSEHRAEAAHA